MDTTVHIDPEALISTSDGVEVGGLWSGVGARTVLMGWTRPGALWLPRRKPTEPTRGRDAVGRDSSLFSVEQVGFVSTLLACTAQDSPLSIVLGYLAFVACRVLRPKQQRPESRLNMAFTLSTQFSSVEQNLSACQRRVLCVSVWIAHCPVACSIAGIRLSCVNGTKPLRRGGCMIRSVPAR